MSSLRLLVIIPRAGHEGVAGLVVGWLLAAGEAEVGQHLGALADAADDLGQQTVGRASLDGMGLKDVALARPHLGRSLAVVDGLLLL